jgi:DNA invertase Pin-like site-specific DNA recombinase
MILATTLRIITRSASSALCEAPHKAEFERELIRERTMAGMRAAKRRGRHVGRPRKLTPHKPDHATQLIADGTETRAGAAALLGVDAVTLRRALKVEVLPSTASHRR